MGSAFNSSGINKRNSKPQAVSVALIEPILNGIREIAEMAFLRTDGA